MTQSVQEILNACDDLADAEKREAFSEILRRVRSLRYDLPSDEELVLVAEELLLDLDRRETADEHD